MRLNLVYVSQAIFRSNESSTVKDLKRSRKHVTKKLVTKYKTGPEGPVLQKELAAARTTVVIAAIVSAEAGDKQDPNQPFAAVVAAKDTTAIVTAVIASTVAAQNAAIVIATAE